VAGLVSLAVGLADAGRVLHVSARHSPDQDGLQDVHLAFVGLRSFRLVHWDCSVEREAVRVEPGGALPEEGGPPWSLAAAEVGTLYVDADAVATRPPGR